MQTHTTLQRITLINAAIFVIGMFLFPPFKSRYDGTFLGYHFLNKSRSQNQMRNTNSTGIIDFSIFDKRPTEAQEWESKAPNIFFELLGLQYAVLVVAGGLLFIAFKK